MPGYVDADVVVLLDPDRGSLEVLRGVDQMRGTTLSAKTSPRA